MTPSHENIPETALMWLEQGRQVALATVIQTWGSAPRPIGSQLVISDQADMQGSVSGGCVEGAVVTEALDALQDGQCRILDYGVSDNEAFDVGLACGGNIKVLVEPIGVGQGPDKDIIQRLAAFRRARQAVAYRVYMDKWVRDLILDDVCSDDIATAFRNDKSFVAEDCFIGIHNPPLKLVVVGAVHIAQPLLQMAALVGYDTTLVDPRDAFAADNRFPNQTILKEWPDVALQSLGLDQRTAVVTLTHDPKLDDPAIQVALKSPIFYLGCLGSKKTHAKRVDRLAQAGFSDAEIAHIHAPVGADIGAKSPAEIAVSIMAEMTERLRRPHTRPHTRAGEIAP